MLSDDAKWALEYLKGHGHQSSIDWEADFWFAKHLKDEFADVLGKYIRGAGVWSTNIDYGRWEALTRKRLRALRVLVSWTPSGAGQATKG